MNFLETKITWQRLFFGFVIVAALCLVPVRKNIRMSGIAYSSERATLYASQDGKVVRSLPRGESVHSGDVLFEILPVPWKGARNDPRYQHASLKTKEDKLNRRLALSHNQSEKDRLTSELGRIRANLAKSTYKQSALGVGKPSAAYTAPFAGVLQATSPDAVQGAYVVAGDFLGTLIAQKVDSLVLLCGATELEKIHDYTHVKARILGKHSWTKLKKPKVMGDSLTGKEASLLLARLSIDEEWLYKKKFFQNILNDQKNFVLDFKIDLGTLNVDDGTPVEVMLETDWQPFIQMVLEKTSDVKLVLSEMRFVEPTIALYLGLYYLDYFYSAVLFFIFFYLSVLFNEKELKRCFAQSKRAHFPKDQEGITVIVPFFNEEYGIVPTIRSLERQNAKIAKIILVDDGSQDGSFAQLKKNFKLTANGRAKTRAAKGLFVEGAILNAFDFDTQIAPATLIQKKNAGKGNALNAGINLTTTRLVCTLDADTLLKRDAILQLAYPFFEDARIKASNGSLRIVNDCVIQDGEVVEYRLPRGFLEKCQTAEYLRWNYFKAMNNVQDDSAVISGAFACFDTDMLRTLNGFTGRNIVEDQDLCLHMQMYLKDRKLRRGIVYVPTAVAWTQAPFSFVNLLKQRIRWEGGTLLTLLKYKAVLFRPKYGWLGCYTYPRHWFFIITIPLRLVMGPLGLPLQLFLYFKSDLFRLFISEYLLIFAVPLWLATYGYRAFYFIYIDKKYVGTFGHLRTYVEIFLFSLIAAPIYSAITMAFEFIAYVKALSSELAWNQVERIDMTKKAAS